MISKDSLGIQTLLNLGKDFGVETFRVNPGGVYKLNLYQEMGSNKYPELTPRVYLYSFERGITLIEKNQYTLGQTLHFGDIYGDFSHFAIFFPSLKVMKIHTFSFNDLIEYDLKE